MFKAASKLQKLANALTCLPEYIIYFVSVTYMWYGRLYVRPTSRLFCLLSAEQVFLYHFE